MLLYGAAYWREVIDFEALVRHGMIAARDLELFRYVESPREALAALKEGLAEEIEDATPAFAKTCTCGRPVAGRASGAATCCDPTSDGSSGEAS